MMSYIFRFLLFFAFCLNFTANLLAATSLGAPDNVMVQWQNPNARVNWQPSTDHAPIAGYQVYRNGILAGTTPALEFLDLNLAPNTAFQYSVQAYDTLGNTSLAIIAPDLQTPDTPDGLIAWWDFNETNGDTVTDHGSLGNHGVLTDGPIRGKQGNRSFIAFDGLNDRVQNIPAGPLAYSGGGDRTFALWLWPDHHDKDGGSIFSKPWNNQGAYNYGLSQLADGKLQWHVQGAKVIAPIALAPDQWHQVVITIKSIGNMSMYLDGQLAASGQNTNTWSVHGIDGQLPLCIGSFFPYGTGWKGIPSYSWQGKLGDMRVYSRALPTNEIRELYNHGKPAAGFPMVTLLAPASTDNFFSQIHLRAEAQDLAGMGGVMFMVDGQALAAEDKTAPYEVTLPNQLVNGGHIFTAVAKNQAGNITSSSPMLVTTAGKNGVIAQPVEPISPDLILPDTWPVPWIAGNEMQITAAPAQFEAASFVLRSEFRDYNGVNVEVSDLSGPGGRLPKEQVDIRLVKAWYQASSAWTGGTFRFGDNTQKLVPELLLRNEHEIT
ncbi:MAG: LamG-like jellyroll fold domain-containing protein [Methylococcaceae bacterium]